MHRIHRQHQYQQQKESTALTTQTEAGLIPTVSTLSTYNGHVYTTTVSSTNAYAAKHYIVSTTPNMASVTGPPLSQISYDGQSLTPSLCGTTSKQDIYCTKGKLSNTPNWVKIQGIFQQVIIRATKLIGIRNDGNIYYTTYDVTAGLITGWTPMVSTISMNQISYDGRTICGTTIQLDLFCHDSGLISTPKWRNISSANDINDFTTITIEGKTIIGRKSDNSLWIGTYTTGISSITWGQIFTNNNFIHLSIDPIQNKIWGINAVGTVYSTENPMPGIVWTVQK